MLIYALLVIPWPGLKEGYAALFRTGGNFVLTGLNLHKDLEFRAPTEPHPGWDVEMHFRDVRTQQRGHAEYSSRAWGYLPTAAVIALTLATPLPWARRWRACGFGLILVHAFIAARVACAVVYALYWGTISTSDFWARTAQVVLLGLSGSPVTTYVAAVVIWLIVAFRREDCQAVFGSPPT